MAEHSTLGEPNVMPVSELAAEAEEEHGALDQFEIVDIVHIEVGGLNLSFTNSALWMAIAVAAITVFLLSATRGAKLTPNRWQMVAETFYNLIANMVRDNVGGQGRRYFPFVFTLFMFVLFGNVIGLVPGAFTYTSHIMVTFAMAGAFFITVNIIGFVRQGGGYGRLFFPRGAPLAAAPVLIPIELISYLSRPVSLSVRLFANMTVGHVLLKIVAGFVVTLGAVDLFVVPGIVPLAALVAVTLLELMVAVIQAYVFAILTCVYLHDALHLH